MINYNPKNWLELIFSIKHGDTIKVLWKPMIYIGILTACVVTFEKTLFPHDNFKELYKVFQLLGFVLSLLLLFRTNTAYDRWWEGRRLWGAIVNDSRNLALKINALNIPLEDRIWYVNMIQNFVISAKEHLRGNQSISELLILSSEEKTYLAHQAHAPLGVMNLLRNKLIPNLNNEERLSMEQNLNGLIDSLGGCERIRNTPIPYSYSIFFKKFIFIFVIILPLGFAELFHYFSILLSVFFFYVLVSVELLAEEIEDPFGTDDNDLPLDAICENIRNNCGQILLDPTQSA